MAMTEPYEIQRQIAAPGPTTFYEASSSRLTWLDASPIEASSGKTSRHRLSRGGDRAASSALWTIAHIRMISDPRTRATPPSAPPPATAGKRSCAFSSAASPASYIP
jgi:Transposase IS116/IS110/IS902 family